jgi:magnesium chelatase family protein
LRAVAGLDERSRIRLAELSDLDGHTARATEHILRVARTIADLEGALLVGREHLDEAAGYRTGRAAALGLAV